MRRAAFLVAAMVVASGARADEPPFAKGLPDRPDYFPIAVWLQDTSNAAKYRDVGINVYVALWRGPTESQLDQLDAAGIRLICGQNRAALRFKDRPTIVGWMHGDEPDNAQSLGEGKGYGPPIAPAKIIDDYHEIRRADPDRPVMLNLGQGVAWDGWYGRGTRTNHPEDYAEYAKGCDIASFDIYPACSTDAAVAGKLWYVPHGVERLRKWAGPDRPVWCCIETTRISNVNRKATPAEIRAEVWMALIRGAKGIIYFAHQFKPTFIEAGLLADRDVAREVAAINRRIRDLAPVLNSPDVPDGVKVEVIGGRADRIATLVKRQGDSAYFFAASLDEKPTEVRFRLPAGVDSSVEVLDESRTLQAPAGGWSDRFGGYQVHLYRSHPK
ncbi:hypothetical protein OJF2_07480 [Aquisphaera giovannonii]|uniref:Glycoside hydrolase family 42 N-terminal domain-containing protein n=1 Tax=Aquisphaera giovannonii TaxID=406548 RepID=A0A5B9VW21_9BACT|nr:beta-galactosidase [Aquisphaera giovannonii]QEH32279.1 hypothetical protein OJF2_07480 [Aquisphaera giovannonii]